MSRKPNLRGCVKGTKWAVFIDRELLDRVKVSRVQLRSVLRADSRLLRHPLAARQSEPVNIEAPGAEGFYLALEEIVSRLVHFRRWRKKIHLQAVLLIFERTGQVGPPCILLRSLVRGRLESPVAVLALPLLTPIELLSLSSDS